MKAMNEAKEFSEGKYVAEKGTQVAAFFDLDGTLLSFPSLERRFFRMLRYRREIPLRNYFLWAAQAVRLLPRGIRAIAHANKMYLNGVKSFDESGAENGSDSSAHASGYQAGGQVSAPSSKRERCNP